MSFNEKNHHCIIATMLVGRELSQDSGPDLLWPECGTQSRIHEVVGLAAWCSRVLDDNSVLSPCFCLNCREISEPSAVGGV